MHDTLVRLFRFKAWADDELFTALAGLGDESPVVHLAVKALNHSYVVDRIFDAHMNGKPHPYASTNPDEVPTLEDLSTRMRASDKAYVDHVSTLDRDMLSEQVDFTFTDGTPGRMSREEMLMHVITHGIGHRGQVSALMLLNEAAPATDGFTTYLHRAEAVRRRRSRA